MNRATRYRRAGSICLGLAAMAVLGAAAQPPANATNRRPDPLVGRAKAWSFSSERCRVALVELFTSQEAAAAEPVERLIAGLPQRGYGFDRIVPLVIHVSYWPHLGWTDTLAKPEFMDRHGVYINKTERRAITAPDIYLNGHQRAAIEAGLLRDIDQVNLQPPPIRLSLLAELAANNKTLEVFSQVDRATIPRTPRPATIVYLLVFEMGVTTPVTAGECAGRTLVSDYVVRVISPPQKLNRSDDFLNSGITVALDPAWQAARLGVAAFAQVERSDNVIQACGGLLDPAKAQSPEEP